MATIAQALATALQHHQSGNLQQAEQIYRQILQVDSQHVDALHLLGLIARAVGRNDLAVDFIGQAVRLKPDFAEAHNNLGNAWAALGRLDEAVASIQHALRLKPDYAEAHNNLANALSDQGRLEEAVASYQQALRFKPDLADAHYNLGITFQGQGKLDEAVKSYRRAVQVKPDYAAAYYNLGIALKDAGRIEEAITSFEQAVRIQPNYAEAHHNRGIAFKELGKPDHALACFEQAVLLKPDLADAHWNRSEAWLLRGNFEQGWPEYEWRWKCKRLAMPSFHQPLWDGLPLAGRTILLHAEQGLGDTLQFIRYAPLLKDRGGSVIVECPPPLFRLLAGCPGIDRLISKGAELPPFDVHAPLMSVPRILGTSLATVPANVPYLFADSELVERWGEKLRATGEFKIGIAWRGNPKYPDRGRSIPLVQFAPLARVEGVRLVSLQKGPGTEQLREVADKFPVMDLGSDLDEASGAFMDTAAVMRTIDLVITLDTSIPHLAGGLGVPVWLALPFAPEWRWLLEREDSPWYPTMRLFRQTERNNWAPVFERMARELEKSVAVID